MALDAAEDVVYFRIGKEEADRYLDKEVEIKGNFGPRNMGAGPSGLAKMNLETGETEHVISVPFQVGHIQANPWEPGEIVFCWETGGKSPQRTWTVRADGTGLRPLYPESPYEWVTHEAVITRDEVAMAIMGHRKIGMEDAETIAAGSTRNPGQEKEWGPSGVRANAICPGFVQTRFSRVLWQDEAMMERLNASLPLGRIGQPEEMAGLAVFLASEAASYCTGGVFLADGGYMLM